MSKMEEDVMVEDFDEETMDANDNNAQPQVSQEMKDLSLENNANQQAGAGDASSNVLPMDVIMTMTSEQLVEYMNTNNNQLPKEYIDYLQNILDENGMNLSEQERAAYENEIEANPEAEQEFPNIFLENGHLKITETDDSNNKYYVWFDLFGNLWTYGYGAVEIHSMEVDGIQIKIEKSQNPNSDSTIFAIDLSKSVENVYRKNEDSFFFRSRDENGIITSFAIGIKGNICIQKDSVNSVLYVEFYHR